MMLIFFVNCVTLIKIRVIFLKTDCNTSSSLKLFLVTFVSVSWQVVNIGVGLTIKVSQSPSSAEKPKSKHVMVGSTDFLMC